MPIFGFLRRVAASPAVVCAALGLGVRLAALAQAWQNNPLVRWAQLDAYVYLRWAREIGNGDPAGTSGIVGGEPFFFNPLYAYLLAPFMARLPAFDYPLRAAQEVVEPRLLAILVAQCLLGAATTAVTAVAARRLFGTTAAWIAGVAVACSTALVQLDLHIAVSGLGAFLVAGAVLATTAARAEGSDELAGELAAGGGWRAPIIAGLWLGIGALARPIQQLALPLVAWLFLKRSPLRWRAGAAVVVVFFLCAVPTLTRNWAVSGKPYLYTAVGSINLHLGNNPIAWTYRSMSSNRFLFGPTQMHATARRHVAEETQRPEQEVGWDDVSTFFWDQTRGDMLANPGRSSIFLLHKLRWFASPDEVPSSAGLETDRQFTPLLHLAFVPTWLIASLGLVGLWLFRKRREVLLGAGALVAAHVFVLTLVFPISHYRSPAIPALAVLAAGTVTWAIDAWRAGNRRGVAGVVASAIAIVVVAVLPPGPDMQRTSNAMRIAYAYKDMYYVSRSDAHAAAVGHWCEKAREAQAADWPAEPLLPRSWALEGEFALERHLDEQAVRQLNQALRADAQEFGVWVLYSCALQRIGRMDDALGAARNASKLAPREQNTLQRLAEIHRARGEFREAEGYAQQLAQLYPGIQPGHTCEPARR